MAELEANWAGMVQARSHWYIARYRELGLAMTPTLLLPQDHGELPQLGVVSGALRIQQALGESLSIPAASPLDPVVIGALCQA